MAVELDRAICWRELTFQVILDVQIVEDGMLKAESRVLSPRLMPGRRLGDTLKCRSQKDNIAHTVRKNAGHEMDFGNFGVASYK